MMPTATMEKEILHKMIDELPHFQDEDDEPLSADELEQMADTHADPSMRSTWEEIWQQHLTLA